MNHFHHLRRGKKKEHLSSTPASSERMGKRPLHKVFTVEKATEELMTELGVKKWPTWSTAGRGIISTHNTPRHVNILSISHMDTHTHTHYNCNTGSEKYVVGKKSPLKVYDGNELSYIVSGSMDIESQETGNACLHLFLPLYLHTYACIRCAHK